MYIYIYIYFDKMNVYILLFGPIQAQFIQKEWDKMACFGMMMKTHGRKKEKEKRKKEKMWWYPERHDAKTGCFFLLARKSRQLTFSFWVKSRQITSCNQRKVIFISNFNLQFAYALIPYIVHTIPYRRRFVCVC